MPMIGAMQGNSTPQRRDCATVAEFIEALSAPRTAYHGTAQKYDWIFRGCRSSEWSLVPSALGRAGNGLPYPTRHEQGRFERYILRQFFLHCDRNGLAVPGDSPSLRALLEKEPLFKSTWFLELPDEALALAAIAQHHGVPTRLLDWSWNPLAAAYFACRDVEPREAREPTGVGASEPTSLCVWALHIDLFRDAAAQEQQDSALGGRLRLVTVPTASNPNLRAQEGVFTQWVRHLHVDQRGGTGGPPDQFPLNEAFAQCADPAVRDRLVQITLPSSQRTQLYSHLRFLGMGRSRLFPGYEAAALEAVWDTLPSWNPRASESIAPGE